MLRQISLEVRAENRLQDVARSAGVKISVVECRAFNKKGMTLLIEVEGPAKAVQEAVLGVRKMEGVRQAIEGEGSAEALPVLVVLDRPTICRASSDAAIICLDCPLNSEKEPATWRFIAQTSGDLRQIITNLNREHIQSRIEDVSPMDQKASLTVRQKEIIATAMARGYFDFPRKVSLTELSQLVGVKPSTLSEILRSAERRIMQNAIEIPFQTNGN